VRAAVGLAAAAGQARRAGSALGHFASLCVQDATPHLAERRTAFVVDLCRQPPFGREHWIVDAQWALRMLEGGGILAWQGDFAHVVATLATFDSAALPTR
jgi:hypothetical protein